MSTASSIASQKTLQQIIDATSAGAKGRKTGEMGKDEFLNLLVTQLRYQDPLNPVEDKEFIGQMAQFSSLEQMQNMNNTISSSKAFGMIGKRISANIVDETTKKATVIEGTVTNVKMSQGKTFLVVKGEDVPVDSVTDISDGSASSETNIAAFTNLIGFTCSGAVYDPDTGDIVKAKGEVISLQTGVYEDYAVMDGVEFDIVEIVTETPSTDPDFMKNSLEEAREQQTEITVMVADKDRFYKVPVTAKIREYTIEGGKIKAVLDSVNVPVESIMKITRE